MSPSSPSGAGSGRSPGVLVASRRRVVGRSRGIRTWRSGTTYRARWMVAQKEWHESFTTRALAESFRADLLSLARQGEPFDIATGRPASWQRPEPVVVSWYEHACAFVDMKWPHA